MPTRWTRSAAARPHGAADVTDAATPDGRAGTIAATLRRLLPPRRLDIVEHVLSVLLAIQVAHMLGAANINWAAFTRYMVLRGHLADTLARGVLRIAGTLARWPASPSGLPAR